MDAEHVEAELPELLLGTLDPEERVRVEVHLRTCELCAEQRDRLAVGLTALDPAPVGPSPGAQQRLMSQLAGAARFSHLVPRLAELFDLPLAAVQRVLASIDDEQSWQEGPAQGVSLLPIEAGEKLQGSICTLVRLEPDATFPEHEHFGEEKVLVLQGGFRTSDGTEFWRGELEVEAPGTSHSFKGLKGLPCICVAITSLPT